MIKEWIESYNPKTRDQINQALREIMQEIALTGLQRSGFFEKAAFYGGTALRIFHQLDRIYLPEKCMPCFSENGNNVSREEIGIYSNGN
jgi:glutathionyl-hydroquinone reductase